MRRNERGVGLDGPRRRSYQPTTRGDDDRGAAMFAIGSGKNDVARAARSVVEFGPVVVDGMIEPTTARSRAGLSDPLTARRSESGLFRDRADRRDRGPDLRLSRNADWTTLRAASRPGRRRDVPHRPVTPGSLPKDGMPPGRNASDWPRSGSGSGSPSPRRPSPQDLPPLPGEVRPPARSRPAHRSGTIRPRTRAGGGTARSVGKAAARRATTGAGSGSSISPRNCRRSALQGVPGVRRCRFPDRQSPPRRPTPSADEPEPAAVPPDARRRNPPPTPSPAEADPAAALAETTERLDKLPRDDAKDATPATKALRAVLEERLKLLKEWDKVVKERHAAENPEHQPREARRRVEGRPGAGQGDPRPDGQGPRRPPPRRRSATPPRHVPEPARAEMKEAIDAAQAELKDWSAKLEQVRSDPSTKPGGAAADGPRPPRQVATAAHRPQGPERRARGRARRGQDARGPRLAREALVNGQWEARVEAERLRGLEAAPGAETRRAELSGLNLQVLEAHVQLAQRTLDRMKQRYQAIAVASRSATCTGPRPRSRPAPSTSDDPLERYRARRTAELLELEARVVTNENALTTNPPPSYDEQRALADRAEADFAEHQEAARRRQGQPPRRPPAQQRLPPARRRAVADRPPRPGRRGRPARPRPRTRSATSRWRWSTTPATTGSSSTTSWSASPPAAHPKAEQVFEEFEAKHLALLDRRRAALDKLAQRAEQTHQQVLRRLRILDDHFGFIRTHMFWVRDEEPVGGGDARAGPARAEAARPGVAPDRRRGRRPLGLGPALGRVPGRRARPGRPALAAATGAPGASTAALRDPPVADGCRDRTAFRPAPIARPPHRLRQGRPCERSGSC